MAATAWYPQKLDPCLPTSRRSGRGEEVRAGEYARAPTPAIAWRRRTGRLPSPGCTATACRGLHPQRQPASTSRFQKESAGAAHRGRLDARYEGIDHDAAGEYPAYDAANTASARPSRPRSTPTPGNARVQDRRSVQADELPRGGQGSGRPPSLRRRRSRCPTSRRICAG